MRRCLDVGLRYCRLLNRRRGVHRAFTLAPSIGRMHFEQMMDGLNDVEAFLAGEQEGFKAHVPQDVDVKAIRNRLGMTQARLFPLWHGTLNA